MKAQLLILFSISSISAFAQDCFFCLPNYSFTQPHVPEWPIEYTKIEKIDYERNTAATYCKRPVDIVDTIVLHHSESPSTTTPEAINQMHLERSSGNDPWYMIAYSYVINSPYPGAQAPRARVTEGRPMDIVGAHAGSNAFVPLDPEQKKMIDDGLVTCGKDTGEFKFDPTLMKDGKIKANVTTIGMVVIGNYSPFSSTNPNGYRPSKPRYLSAQTIDMVARMACQLQKKHPRIKNLRIHRNYHNTSCPGNIGTKGRDGKVISQIYAQTRKYGCTFY